MSKSSNEDIHEYYRGNHEYEFFINSWNLFSKSNLVNFLSKYDFTIESDMNKKHEKEHDLRTYILDNLDEFNYSIIIRLAIACELSLKGIFINKKINIFLGDPTKISINNKSKTLGMSHLINNLFSVLSDEDCEKYEKMMYFFRDKRNLFVHLAKEEYTGNNEELMDNLKLINDYFNKVVLPLKDESSLKKSRVC